jgi:hypothetical protein
VTDVEEKGTVVVKEEGLFANKPLERAPQVPELTVGVMDPTLAERPLKQLSIS